MSIRKNVYGGLLIVAALAAGTSSAWSYTALGAGSSASCGRWLAARENAATNSSDNITSAMMLSWALGFITGTAYMSDANFDPLKGLDADAIQYWLDNYCRAKPTDLFMDALEDFVLGKYKPASTQRK